MHSPAQARLLSWSVHLFTASGAVLGTFALIGVARGDLATAALLMLVALFVDGIDGTLARAARVAEHVPEIDGRRLDDIIDYLNFVIVPVLFLWRAESVLHEAWLVAPVVASAVGFSRRDAKTDDDFFLGFPSYWNVLALYLWLLGLGAAAGTAWVVGLSVAVFVPMKYLYPSKVQPPSLRIALGIGALVWTLVLALCVAAPEAVAGIPLIELSLAYPAWYLYLSFRRGGLARRSERSGGG